MSDDIGARLGIIHRAGCMGPTTIAAMPLATMMGRNPYIVAVADGKGGELFACRLCGMVQGQRPDPETVYKARRRSEIVDAYCAVRDDGKLRPTVENVAAQLDMSESSLKRERADLGMTGWPPTLDPK